MIKAKEEKITRRCSCFSIAKCGRHRGRWFFGNSKRRRPCCVVCKPHRKAATAEACPLPPRVRPSPPLWSPLYRSVVRRFDSRGNVISVTLGRYMESWATSTFTTRSLSLLRSLSLFQSFSLFHLLTNSSLPLLPYIPFHFFFFLFPSRPLFVPTLSPPAISLGTRKKAFVVLKYWFRCLWIYERMQTYKYACTSVLKYFYSNRSI